jgi:hypothetical protein
VAKRARRPKGTGTIRDRNGRFQGIVRYVDPRTGKRRQKGHTFDTKTEAQSWIASALAEIERIGPITRDVDTVGSFLRLWLESRNVTELSPSTRSWYTSAVENHIIPALGSVKLDKITAAKIDSFLASKLSEGRLDGRSGGLSPSSVRRLYVTLRRSTTIELGAR